MKRVAPSLAMLLTIAVAGSLPAQGMRFGIGGGELLPLNDYKRADRAGFLVGADATFWLPAPIGLRVEGDFSQTSHKSGVGGHTTLYSGVAELVWALGPRVARMRPYLLGGVGYMHGRFATTTLGTGTQNSVVFGAGGGVTFKLGTNSWRAFVEGRWQSFQSTPSLKMIPIRVGFRFGR